MENYIKRNEVSKNAIASEENIYVNFVAKDKPLCLIKNKQRA